MINSSKKLLAAASGASISKPTINVVNYATTTGTSMFIPQTTSNQLVVMYVYARLSTTTIPSFTTPSGFTNVKTFGVNAASKGVRLSVHTRFGAYSAGSVSGVRGTGTYAAAVALILERPSSPFTSNAITTDTTSAWYQNNSLTTNTQVNGSPPSTTSPYLMIQFASIYSSETGSDYAASSGFGTKIRVSGTNGDVSVIYYESNATQSTVNALATSTKPTSVIVDYVY